MFRRAFLFAGLFLLAGCADAYQTQFQDVSVETPGARDSICFLYVSGTKYKADPPQTISISRSKDDLIVDCRASGNRAQKQIIHPKISKYANAEIGTLNFPGFAWDYFSDAAYQYPAEIVVDFTHAPILPEAMPAQNAPDVKQPEEYNLEEVIPGRPRMNSDKYELPFHLEPREKEDAPPVDNSGKMITPGGNTPGKGDLQKVINDATSNPASVYKSATPAAINPAGPPSPSAAKAGPPAPLYPGQ